MAAASLKTEMPPSSHVFPDLVYSIFNIVQLGLQLCRGVNYFDQTMVKCLFLAKNIKEKERRIIFSFTPYSNTTLSFSH